MNTTPSYEEVVDFIATGTTPESVVAFRPTQAAIQRVEGLIARSRDGIISSEEQAQFNDYLQLEHLLILAKTAPDRNSDLRPEISDELRDRVAVRAKRRREYCLLHEDHSYWPHQIDHVISLKHGGSSDFENLAYACLRCNGWKGSDIGSLDANHFVPLFNPRKDQWADHFLMRGFVIEPLKVQGRVTARLLRLNIDQRLSERRAIGRS